MAVLDERGYLENPYLTIRYLSGEIDYGLGMQVDLKINQQKTTGQQVDLKIDDEQSTGMEVKVGFPQHLIHETYLSTFPYLTEPYLSQWICALGGMQVDLKINDQANAGMQTNLGVNESQITGMQVDQKIGASDLTGMQVNTRNFVDDQIGMQVDAKVFEETATGMEVNIGFPQHLIHETYLSTFPYLSEPYLSQWICALGSMQVELFIVSEDDDSFNGMQVDQKIKASDLTGMQALLRIYTEDQTGMQVDRIRAEKTGFQTTMVIYNTTQLRILCDFPSRGIVSNNWTSPQGTETGDFGLENLNTDVIEQRAQSPFGITALWELISDTGATNTFVDTIAILNHNFTTSAVVSVQGSDDPSFASVKFTFTMSVELTNMYYIAPTLPTQSARYYKFLIQDPTNPDGYLRAGTILFGTSLILSRRACFENPVSFGLKHFKDSLETEGFTSVSNDRALRRILGLEFVNLKVDGADYDSLVDYFKTAKTDLKCLVIPKPERASTLAVFSKLVELPVERHMANTEDDWRVELNLEYDESL